MEIRDVIIVGSGPAGYTAAIYTARAGLKPLVFESSLEAGGALMNTTDIENFPGFPQGIPGPELMMQMREQAARFGAELIADDVMALDLSDTTKVVKDSEGNEYHARSVILAMGSGYRNLGLASEAAFVGKGVSWCATCDGFFYRGKSIAVVGGGDSAIEEATFLTRFADKVTLIHRRDSFRASNIMVQRLQDNDKIELVFNSEVVALNGTTQLESLTLRNVLSGEESELYVSGLFEAIGHTPRSELVADQVELIPGGYVRVVPDGTATSAPGVFACGDLVDHVYRQAISAAGSGCKAALDAERYLLGFM